MVNLTRLSPKKSNNGIKARLEKKPDWDKENRKKNRDIRFRIGRKKEIKLNRFQIGQTNPNPRSKSFRIRENQTQIQRGKKGKKKEKKGRNPNPNPSFPFG